MGYALFTARKLSLQTRVNQLNAQLMAISNQQDALTQKITNKQMETNLKIANSNTKAYSIFASSSQSTADSTKLNKTLSDNELASTLSNVEIQGLQAKVDVLDTTRQSLQTQLTAAQNELSQVENTEESAIKNATPKYVA